MLKLSYLFMVVELRTLSVLKILQTICRVGLVEVLLGLLDWRAGGRNGFSSQMKWNESEASIGRVLAIEVVI